MPTSMDVGFVLFWFGVFAAYAGTMWLPTVANSRKTALWLLALSVISGWAAMFAAASLFDYTKAWLDMPAAYLAGGICTVTGVISIFSKPKEEQ